MQRVTKATGLTLCSTNRPPSRQLPPMTRARAQPSPPHPHTHCALVAIATAALAVTCTAAVLPVAGTASGNATAAARPAPSESGWVSVPCLGGYKGASELRCLWLFNDLATLPRTRGCTRHGTPTLCPADLLGMQSGTIVATMPPDVAVPTGGYGKA